MKITEKCVDPTSAGQPELAAMVTRLQTTIEATEERVRRTQLELSVVRSDLIRVALIAGDAATRGESRA